MKLLKTTVYVGPNIFAPYPLIRLSIDLGKFAKQPSREHCKKLEPLLSVAPALAHAPEEGGAPIFERMRKANGCMLGEFTAHLAVALQQQAESRPEVQIARVEESKDSSVVEVLYGYVSREVGLRAGEIARLMVLEMIDPDPDYPFNMSEEIADFMDLANSRALGPSALALVRAAEERGIPWMRLNNASLIQLGQGKYQKRIEAALTSATSHIAVEIAKDKGLCTQLLHDLGLPVPEQSYVRDARAAVRAAKAIGYPVCVKPIDGNHGRGVVLNVASDDEVRQAFDVAREEGSGVVVESMITGSDHRLLLVGGKLVAAAKRVPAHVVGDGKSTIAHLVAEVNKDPRRGVGHENLLTRIEIDATALALLSAKGYTPETVPPAGEEVFLKETANLSTGGSAVDVTDIVHPENRIMAERAIQAVGLDVGGIDFLTTDIAQSYRDTGGAICEVNAGPGIRMHIAPSSGKPRDVGGAVMDMLFPQGSPSRIPIAALTGTNGKTTTARMLAHLLKMSGYCVGQTSTDAVMIDGNVTVRGDMTGPVAADIVLRDPSVDVAVLETARGGIVRAGLGYRFCDVGAVLNVTPDHLGLGGIDTLEELARVKRLVVEVARDTAVLSADNVHTLAMAEHSPAKHICYVTMTPNNAFVREHIRLGQRAAVLEHRESGDQIVLYDHGAPMPLLWTHLIPATVEGKALFNVENAMFAASMGYAMGLTLNQIRAGLRTFNNSYYQSPGRMNIFDELGFKVILDYGHNEAAIKSMVSFVERLNMRGERIVCLTTPGDRRDEDVLAVARAAAGKFTRYICHMDDDLRGREPREIPEILQKELIACGVAPEAIEIIPKESEAVDRALSVAKQNDLVLLFCGGITRAWKQIIYFKPSNVVAPAKEPLVEPETDLDVPPGYTVVRDERGIRLLRRA